MTRYAVFVSVPNWPDDGPPAFLGIRATRLGVRNLILRNSASMKFYPEPGDYTVFTVAVPGDNFVQPEEFKAYKHLSERPRPVKPPKDWQAHFRRKVAGK